MSIRKGLLGKSNLANVQYGLLAPDTDIPISYKLPGKYLSKLS